MCAREFAAASRKMQDGGYAEELENRVAELCKAVEENAWDGEYYLRAFYDDGTKMGSKDSESCKIDLLPQAFAVLCGLPDKNRSTSALRAALSRLVDEKNGLIKLFDPPFEADIRPDPGYVSSYPAGVRENGGQYTHAAVWLCLACFKAGLKEEGVRLLKMLSPAEKGAKFGNEPYAMTADIYTNPHCCGRGGWSLYTGAAGWYWKCIFEGLFGVEVKGKKVTVKPALTEELSGVGLTVAVGGDKLSLRFIYKKNAPEETVFELNGDRSAEVYYR